MSKLEIVLFIIVILMGITLSFLALVHLGKKRRSLARLAAMVPRRAASPLPRSAPQRPPRSVSSDEPSRHESCLDQYLKLSPRPPIMVAERVQYDVGDGSIGTQDVIFYPGDTDEISGEMRVMLLCASRIGPVDPENLNHRAGCRRDLASFAEVVAMRLEQVAKRGQPQAITDDESRMLDIYHAIFDNTEPGRVERTFADAMRQHRGGTAVLTDLFKSRRCPMPQAPVRRRTTTMAELAAMTEAESTPAYAAEAEPAGAERHGTMLDAGGLATQRDVGPTRSETLLGVPRKPK